MRPRLRAFSRYRPRVLTLVVLLATATLIMLANLSFEVEYGKTGVIGRQSYGWPFVWHRYVTAGLWERQTVGWYYTPTGLAADAAIWLLILAGMGAPCELLVRRYRPRLRWSLRTMLVAVALAATVLGLFAQARNRANLQDPLIAENGNPLSDLVVERWGPRWLDLFGFDRFRRRIVSATVHVDGTEGDEQFEALTQLPALRRVDFEVSRVTPALPAALEKMQQLRTLRIHRMLHMAGDNERVWDECLLAIEKMPHLENLELWGMTLNRESSSHLASLTNLKSLSIAMGSSDDKQISQACMAAIASMTRLEYLSLGGWNFPKGSLTLLSRLQNLKSLQVRCQDKGIAHECLEAIGKLASLESLNFASLFLDAESLSSLAGLAKLKSFEFSVGSTNDATLLKRLPALSQVEAVKLHGSSIRDDELRYLAVLPHLRFLDIGAYPDITIAGLSELASLKGVEELTFEGDIVSAAALERLRAVGRLKRLHLYRLTNEFDEFDPPVTVNLDDGGSFQVPKSESKDFRRALQALRQAKPGIVIDTNIGAIGAHFRTRLKDEPLAYSYDKVVERRSTWWPESLAPWFTPAQRAAFEQAGGWARFDAACCPVFYGEHITESF